MKDRVTASEVVVTALFHTGFPGSVVAGGYLRDTILGIAPKDMDVFIPRSTLPTEQLEKALSEAVGAPVSVEFNLSYANMEVKRIFTTTDVRQLPIQFIEMGEGVDPQARVREHDFGLCQVWMDLDGVHTTEAFESDMRAKTCTLVHCESEAEWNRSMRRWDRLKEKLVGIRLVDPTPYAKGTQLELAL